MITPRPFFISLSACLLLGVLIFLRPAIASSATQGAPPASSVDIQDNFYKMNPESQAGYNARGSGPAQGGSMPWEYSTFLPTSSPPYHQPQIVGNFDYYNGAEKAWLNYGRPFDGLPMTFADMAQIDVMSAMRASSEKMNPNNLRSMASVVGQTLTSNAGNAIGSAANEACNAGFNECMGGGGGGAGGAGGAGGGGGGAGPGDFSGFGGLINIANPNSGMATSPYIPFKIVPQAVWMVQQMYKNVFIPMSLLFLLVGAVITQTKAQVTAGFNLKADDASSPFEGILRAMIALFLIFSTQLIVSYSIDVGNSMAASVANYVDLQAITTWAQQLMYVPQQSQNSLMESGGGAAASGGANVFGMASAGNWGGLASAGGGSSGGGGGGDEGLASDQPAAQAVNEKQSFLSQAMKSVFNTIAFLFSMGLVILGAFQLVYMCYLYLLGPLSAAFYAWPTVQGKLFRTVFGNWLNAVIVLSLWRFYWMVILAIMTLRLFYMSDHGGIFNLEFEVAVFTCLIGLMFYIPMSPWNFDPAQAYMTAKDIGEQLTKGAGAGGGGGGDGGDGGGGGGGEDNDLEPEKNSAQPQQSHAQQSGQHNEGTSVPATPPPASEEPANPSSSDHTALNAEGVPPSEEPTDPGFPAGSANEPPIERLADSSAELGGMGSTNSDMSPEQDAISGVSVADLDGGEPPISPVPGLTGATPNDNVTNSADFGRAAMDFSPIIQGATESVAMVGEPSASMAEFGSDASGTGESSQGNPPQSEGQVT